MNYLARVMVAPIRLYQRIVSPLLGPRCRFYPSCSEYTGRAIVRYGPIRGLYLGVRRLLRCHPWNPGGVDEIPEAFSWRRPHLHRRGRAWGSGGAAPPIRPSELTRSAGGSGGAAPPIRR